MAPSSTARMQASSARPGMAATFGLVLPMTPVFENFMSPTTAGALAAILATPGMIGMTLGGNHAATRVVFAMSRAGMPLLYDRIGPFVSLIMDLWNLSGVLPEALGQTRRGTAFNAIITVSVCGWLALCAMALSQSMSGLLIYLNTMTLCRWAASLPAPIESGPRIITGLLVLLAA